MVRRPASKPIHRVNRFCASIIAATVLSLTAYPCAADQGGIGFWLPGTFGSLAATPLEPGWSLGLLYIHSAITGGGDVAASRAINLPNRTVNLSVNLDAKLKGVADMGAISPTYVFATPVLGGQFALTGLAIVGHQQASIDANITGALGPIGFATERSISDSLTGVGDLFLQPSLRWNQGVHSYMIYGLMNFPIGTYDPSRIVSLGLGHWSI